MRPAYPTPSTVAPTAVPGTGCWSCPIVLPLLTLLYNADAPRLLGFPTFYWLQFAFILVGVTTTSIVYQMTKRGR